MADKPTADADRETVAWRIRGRVQGVAFRWFTRSAALRLGVDGWVRNLPDGSVEAQVRGPKDALRQLEQRLRRGPEAAQVRGFDEQALDPSIAMAPGFEIRY